MLANLVLSVFFSSTDNLTEKSRMEFPKAFAENQVFWPDSTTTKNIQVAETEATEGLKKQISRAITLEHTHRNYSRLHVPPPLPKSPSDSWLWRTLPSMSAKSSSLHSYLSAATNPQNQCSTAHTSDIKWETTVKTASVQRRHIHYSEVSLFKNCLDWYVFRGSWLIISFFSGIIDNYTINFKEGLSEVMWLIQKHYLESAFFFPFLLDSNELVTIL